MRKFFTFFLLFLLFLGTTPSVRAEPDTASFSDWIQEPMIRVGLLKTKEPVSVTVQMPYALVSGEETKTELLPGESVTFSYSNGKYLARTANSDLVSETFFRLVPADPANDWFEISSYTRTVPGRKKVNFNVYRGIFEYRFAPKSAMPYVINELPLESYVLGVAETSDDAPYEYIKALQVAARSYAYANISQLPPTDRRLFDVSPTTVDQIYLGYRSEEMMPQVVEATRETIGEMVTYQGRPVITYYFSQSNGTTRTWRVFGKTPRPWLESVAAVYDKGRKLSGHGVGMSCRDALMRAKKDGWSYDMILSHYFSNTTVAKMY